jgi:hypothetical protein
LKVLQTQKLTLFLAVEILCLIFDLDYINKSKDYKKKLKNSDYEVFF